MAAAKVMKEIFDEIRAEDPKAKIIAMGDFNDDPINHSIKKGLGTVGNRDKVKDEDIYNPMEVLYKRKGIGTLAYRDAWNVFDQILTDRKSTRLNSSHVAISYAVFCLKKKNRTDR